MERSAHVKEQLQALESEVLRAQKTYNELKTERYRRETALERLTDAYAFLTIGEKTVSVIDRVSTLSEQLRKAQNQLASETAMTETLEYMIAERRKQITFRAQPTVPMQHQLRTVTALKEGNFGLVSKAEMEIKTKFMKIKALQVDFIRQKNRHSGLLDALLEQHAYQKEFQEMSSEHRLQQKIRSQLLSKEGALTELNFALATVSTHEKNKRERAEQQAALDRLEATVDTMTKAAKTDSSAGILDYWNFLTESEEYLKTAASALEDRIGEAKRELAEDREEFSKEVAALSGPDAGITISDIEEKQRRAGQTLEARQAKVKTKQLAWFIEAEAGLKTAFSHLLEKVQGAGDLEDSVVGLLARLETALCALLPQNN